MAHQVLSSFFVTAFLLLSEPMLFAAEPVKMPLDKLYATAIEDVPEQVHVTHMLDYYGRARMDALVHILEQIPEH